MNNYVLDRDFLKVPIKRWQSENEENLYGSLLQLEAQVRYLTLLAISCCRQETGPLAGTWKTKFGLQSWCDLMKRVAAESGRCETLPDWRLQKIRALDSAVRDALDHSIGNVPGVNRIKQLRDFVAHTGDLPADDSGVQAAVMAARDRLNAGLLDFVHDVEIEKRGDQLWIVSSGGSFRLDPLVRSHDRSGSPLIFSSLKSSRGAWIPIYSHTGPQLGLSELPEASEEIARFIQIPQGDAVRFANSIRKDLEPFGEDDGGAGPLLLQPEDGVVMVWELATSGGVEVRIDKFRLGLDSRKEWYGVDGWTSYSQFLATIVNRSVIARRLAQSYEKALGSMKAREGIQRAIDFPVVVDCHFDIKSLDGQLVRENVVSSDLFDDVDDAAIADFGMTRLTFVTGSAGAGKTHALINASIKRAKCIANGEGDDLPLYLYVAASGNISSDLDRAIDGVLARTLGWHAGIVKTLLRNRSIVLMVDGFDELLGSRHYLDPLAALREWIGELSGGGHLILSARSSYFVQEYRRSVARNGSLNLDHRVAGIRPWSRHDLIEFLAAHGVGGQVLERLHRSELEIVHRPFFAHILAGMKGDRVGQEVSVIAECIEGYLRREEYKLRRGDGRGSPSLVDLNVLRRLFTTMASLMSDSAERELSYDDLRLAANDVLDGGLEQNPQLELRLSSLCGISPSGSLDDATFVFEHEVFFDEFYGLHLVDLIVSERTSAFRQELNGTAWRWATVNVLLEKVDWSTLESILMQVANGTSTPVRNGGAMGFDRPNLGALWNEAIRRGLVLRPRLVSLSFEEELRIDASAAHLELIECVATNIEIGAGVDSVVISDCHVDGLYFDSDASLANVSIRDSTIGALKTNSVFLENWTQVRAHIESSGGEVLPPESVRVGESEIARSAKLFFQKLANRGTNRFITLENFGLVNEDETARMWSGSVSEFQQMVRNLESFELVIRRPSRSTSGSAKVFLQLTVPISELCASPEERRSESVDGFWRALS